MKFQVNDKTYFVKWDYDGSHTHCYIYDNTSSYHEPLIEANAFLAQGDRFNKNTGRKISLDRALKQLFPDTLTIHGELFPKEARAIAWKEYFNESPKRLK